MCLCIGPMCICMGVYDVVPTGMYVRAKCPLYISYIIISMLLGLSATVQTQSCNLFSHRLV